MFRHNSVNSSQSIPLFSSLPPPSVMVLFFVNFVMMVMLKMKWKFIALKMRWLQIKREHVQDKSGWGLLIRKWCPGNLRDPNMWRNIHNFGWKQIGNAVDHHLEVEPQLICWCLPCSCPAFQLGESLDNVNLFLNEHLSDPLGIA